MPAIDRLQYIYLFTTFSETTKVWFEKHIYIYSIILLSINERPVVDIVWLFGGARARIILKQWNIKRYARPIKTKRRPRGRVILNENYTITRYHIIILSTYEGFWRNATVQWWSVTRQKWTPNKRHFFQVHWFLTPRRSKISTYYYCIVCVRDDIEKALICRHNDEGRVFPKKKLTYSSERRKTKPVSVPRPRFFWQILEISAEETTT